MKTFTLTMRIETDDDITDEQIRGEVYEACDEVPFSFHIIRVDEEM
ncbi:hypothetical protein [Streptomyces sp. NPDC095613]